MDSCPIFISHSSLNKDIAEAFINLIVNGIPIHKNDIFCTSVPGHDIPAGPEFKKYISSSLKNAKIVILLISDLYFESVFCVCELGAAWATKPIENVIPLVIPPYERENVKAVLNGKESKRINEPSDLDQIRDQFVGILRLKNPKTTFWNNAKKKFLAILEQLAAEQPPSTKVGFADFRKIESEKEQLESDLSDSLEENSKLKVMIAALEGCKDQQEVQKVKESYSNDWEKFQNLIEELQEDLSKWGTRTRLETRRSVMLEAFYFYWKGEAFVFNMEDQEEVSKYEQKNYLIIPDTDIPKVELNDQDKTVKKTNALLDKLAKFLEKMEEADFYKEFQEKYDYEPTLSNRRFWSDIFEIRHF